MINDMTQGHLARQLVAFSVPFVLANLLQSLYTMVDLAIVGQFVGSNALSAVSTSGHITLLLYAVGIGFGSGGQILISQLVGQKDLKGLRATIGTMMTTVTVVSVLLAVIGAVTAPILLALLQTPPEAMEQAISYMTICCIGVPFTYIYASLSAVLRGMGDSKRPLIFILVASLTNVALDLLFVAVLKWEAAGAAWATVLSQMVSAVFAFVYLYRRRGEFGFDFKPSSFAVHKDKLATMTRLSLPLVFMNLFINLSVMYMISCVNVFGVAASAATGVGSKLINLACIISNAIMSATATLVGQNMGAGRQDRVIKTIYIGWLICLGFCAVLMAVSLLFPKAIFGLFSSDPEVLAYAPSYMRIAIWMYLSFALMAPVLGLINGVGFTSLNMIVAILDGVVARLGLCFLLGYGLNMGLHGFWWATALAGYVSVIIPSIYFFAGSWKKRKLLQ